MAAYRAINHSKEVREELAYDLGSAVGWIMAGVAMLFARPIMWAVFGEHHRPKWLRRR